MQDWKPLKGVHRLETSTRLNQTRALRFREVGAGGVRCVVGGGGCGGGVIALGVGVDEGVGDPDVAFPELEEAVSVRAAKDEPRAVRQSVAGSLRRWELWTGAGAEGALLRSQRRSPQNGQNTEKLPLKTPALVEAADTLLHRVELGALYSRYLACLQAAGKEVVIDGAVADGVVVVAVRSAGVAAWTRAEVWE